MAQGLPPGAVSALLSALHVLGIALACGSIFLRARGAGRGGVDDVLAADNAWGLSAIVMIATGLLRAFGGFEKGTAFYLHNGAFHAKLTLLLVVLLFELWPMVTLLRARIQQRDVTAALPRIALLSRMQLVLVVLMACVAPLMARGLFQF
jgi:putative membrane protein